MYDRITETVLELNVSLFSYCLIVLNTTKDYRGDASLIPLFGALLADGHRQYCLADCLFHHVATSITGPIHMANSRKTFHITSPAFSPRIWEMELNSISRIPNRLKKGMPPSQVLTCGFDGYLQYIDSDALMKMVR